MNNDERKGDFIPKILVIDDEVNLLHVFEKVLGEEGYQVITAGDGFEGIKRNEEDNPDLIILDLSMPKMSGVETLQNIRKTDKEVLVIILTGYGSAETAREVGDLSVYEYISKPFKNEIVKRVIKEALKSRKEDG